MNCNMTCKIHISGHNLRHAHFKTTSVNLLGVHLREYHTEHVASWPYGKFKFRGDPCSNVALFLDTSLARTS